LSLSAFVWKNAASMLRQYEAFCETMATEKVDAAVALFFKRTNCLHEGRVVTAHFGHPCSTSPINCEHSAQHICALFSNLTKMETSISLSLGLVVAGRCCGGPKQCGKQLTLEIKAMQYLAVLMVA